MDGSPAIGAKPKPTANRRLHRPWVLRAALLALAGGLGACGFMGRQATIFYLKVDSEFSSKEITMELDRSFVEAFKDRVTIDARFTVDKSEHSPNLPALDGDLHFAGRSPQVALLTVAEIANAGSFPKAVAAVNRADSTNRPMDLTGVWRLWPEHSGNKTVEQGKVVAPTDTYRPNHVFEIHPVMRVGRISLLESFTPVKGFSPGIAEQTFPIYEKTACKIAVRADKISIVTLKGLYNDVEFIMEITGDQPLVVSDGRFVMASALDMKGKVVAEHVRMVFAKGTPPERAVRGLARGARLRVFGIPRVSFAEISRRLRESATEPGVLTRTIPYEIIVLGVFPDTK